MPMKEFTNCGLQHSDANVNNDQIHLMVETLTKRNSSDSIIKHLI